MNRSNVGNVITNGMQILSVTGTNVAGFKRGLNRDKDASLRLQQDNETYDMKRQLLQGKIDEQKLKVERRQQIVDKGKGKGTSSGNGTSSQSPSVDVDAIMGSFSPQSQNINSAISRYLDYGRQRDPLYDIVAEFHQKGNEEE